MSSGDQRGKGQGSRSGSGIKCQPFTVNRNYDIAYLAGYSTDGKTIYIDRHLPGTIGIGDRKVNVTPFLVAHECAEKAAIDTKQLPYATAHKDFGNVAERAKLRAAGINEAAYARALKPYIKADEHEKIVKSPRNLDLVPYRAKPRNEMLLRAIIEAGTSSKVSKTIANYSTGNKQSHCGNCQHYKDHSCEVVSGRIDPAYWCKYWEGK